MPKGILELDRDLGPTSLDLLWVEVNPAGLINLQNQENHGQGQDHVLMWAHQYSEALVWIIWKREIMKNRLWWKSIWIKKNINNCFISKIFIRNMMKSSIQNLVNILRTWIKKTMALKNQNKENKNNKSRNNKTPSIWRDSNTYTKSIRTINKNSKNLNSNKK